MIKCEICNKEFETPQAFGYYVMSEAEYNTIAMAMSQLLDIEHGSP